MVSRPRFEHGAPEYEAAVLISRSEVLETTKEEQDLGLWHLFQFHIKSQCGAQSRRKQNFSKQ
jgi:hypothetical protein